jgi:hypothetical protein
MKKETVTCVNLVTYRSRGWGEDRERGNDIE